MSRDTKIWLRLSPLVLAGVDQSRGEKTRSEAIRELIDRGLAISPSCDVPKAADDTTSKVSREEAWAAEMGARFLETAAATWKPIGGIGEPTRWMGDAPSSNSREWFAWATALRRLQERHGGAQ